MFPLLVVSRSKEYKCEIIMTSINKSMKLDLRGDCAFESLAPVISKFSNASLFAKKLNFLYVSSGEGKSRELDPYRCIDNYLDVIDHKKTIKIKISIEHLGA
jgi:hypothetical protein